MSLTPEQIEEWRGCSALSVSWSEVDRRMRALADECDRLRAELEAEQNWNPDDIQMPKPEVIRRYRLAPIEDGAS